MVFGDEDAFYQFGEYIGDTILPSWIPLTGFMEGLSEGGLEQGVEDAVHQAAGNTILGGVVDNMVNEDFKGTPIVSSSMEHTPAVKQENNRTTWLAHYIGQITGTSPLKVDHIIDSYTGMLGKINRAVGTMDSSQIDWSLGFENTFKTDSAYSTDEFNKVYEKRDKFEKQFDNSPTPENACRYDKYAQTAAYITQLNKAIRELPSDEQREAKQSLQRDVKDMKAVLTDTDKDIVASLEGEGSLSYANDSMPKQELSYKKNNKQYNYTMSYDEYSQYLKDYIQEVESVRAKTVSSYKYKRATADEKIEMLKNVNSTAKKTVQEAAIRKYRTKFARE